jgi:uncharacterized membrane protein YesL
MKLFDLDGPLMSVLNKLADIIICNIMFCIFSLPLVTMGASLSALYTCVQSIVEDREETMIVRQFWQAFRKNFKQATLLWLISAAAFLFFGIFYFTIQKMEGPLASFYQVTSIVLLILFLMGFQYLFPLQAKYHFPMKTLIKNAWLLCAAALPWTLCAMAVTAMAIWLSCVGNVNLAVYIWAFAGFGLVTYLKSFFFQFSFKKTEIIFGNSGTSDEICGMGAEDD